MLDYIFHSPFNLGVETLLVLITLIALEAVLSADNAIALAAIAQTLHSPRQARRALDVGLGIAYVLRLLFHSELVQLKNHPLTAIVKPFSNKSIRDSLELS